MARAFFLIPSSCRSLEVSSATCRRKTTFSAVRLAQGTAAGIAGQGRAGVALAGATRGTVLADAAVGTHQDTAADLSMVDSDTAGWAGIAVGDRHTAAAAEGIARCIHTAAVVAGAGLGTLALAGTTARHWAGNCGAAAHFRRDLRLSWLAGAAAPFQTACSASGRHCRRADSIRRLCPCDRAPFRPTC